jgi:cell division protein FtsI/penicillin-binding protein 2
VPDTPAASASVPAGPALGPERPATAEPPTAPWPGAFVPGGAPPHAAGARPAGERVAPPSQNGAAPVPRGHGSRHRRPPERGTARTSRAKLPKNLRLIAALVVTVGVLGAGFLDGGFGSDSSPEQTVQAFLLDWEGAHYAQAAALTTGAAAAVTAQLTAAYTDLDATNEIFGLQSVTQHGATAVARYTATVDLGEAGQQWSYVGTFGLTARGGNWVIDWAPSVINPSLGPGDRLAVATTYAPRAAVVGMNGQPLLAKSADYQIGVYPGKLKNAVATAAGFSQAATLDEQQVLGQIQSAPPGDFLALLTLSPAGFRSLWPKLAKVPGLSYQQGSDRLFTSSAPDLIGTIETENSSVLREEGAAYQPGATVGLGGLEQTYQDSLIGTPTTTVEVVNAAGHVTKQWPLQGGHPGTPVATTLNAQEQDAAVSALADAPNSAEIVAVDSATGAIRVLATHSAGNVALPSGGPLTAEVEPGMAFSIVSAAALLATGVSANLQLPCEPVADVGGVTFTYQPVTTASSTFAMDFANGCGTAFANMSRTLTAQQLASAEKAFGIGSTWPLRLASFSGSASPVSGEADMAAQVTGTGGVLVSPLSMATVAAEVAAGVGHSPTLLATDSSTTWQSPLSGTGLTQLRQMMRLAVTSGAANAADLPGTPVYGQAGVVQTGKAAYLSWFVGYRGSLAVAVLETGSSASAAAASLAAAFLKTVG